MVSAYSQIVAGIYVRISKVKRGRGRETLGVERQVPPCRDLCERNGWKVHRVYVDNNQSAYKNGRRDDFNALLADVRNGTINAMVTWQPDRLIRTVPDASAIIEIVNQYGAIVANVGGVLDLSTADGRKRFYESAVAAQLESELQSERLRLKHDELRRDGAWAGGANRPFGYDIVGTEVTDRETGKTYMIDCRLAVNELEAAELYDAVDNFLRRGGTLAGTAADWNRRRVGKTGSMWKGEYRQSKWLARDVKRLFSSPRIAGLREWKGEYVSAEWSPIISCQDFEQLQAILRARPESPRRGPLPRTYLLSGGLSVCGGCELPLRPHATSEGFRGFRCESTLGGCGKIARRAQPIEDFVRDAVLRAFDDSDIGPKLRAQVEARSFNEEQVRKLSSEVEALKSKLRQLEYDY
jgi:site-specific DNA recombinase